jgi:hypothetical protein
VKAYPGPMLSRPETERAWRCLSVTERQAAIDGVAWYVADCAAQKPFARAVRDLKRYLRGKCWEGAKAVPAKTSVPIYGGTPEAAAWLEHERKAGRPTSYTETCWREGKAWQAPSRWPPGFDRRVLRSTRARLDLALEAPMGPPRVLPVLPWLDWAGDHRPQVKDMP